MRYYCGTIDCRGHFDPSDNCLPALDSFCGTPGCPGHKRSHERCRFPNFDPRYPYSCGDKKCLGHKHQGEYCYGIPHFEPDPPPAPFYCSEPGCSGHTSSHGKCLPLLPLDNPTFFKRRRFDEDPDFPLPLPLLEKPLFRFNREDDFLPPIRNRFDPLERF